MKLAIRVVVFVMVLSWTAGGALATTGPGPQPNPNNGPRPGGVTLDR